MRDEHRMEIIDYIELLCQQANPEYVFMHEEAEMINVKIDGLTRGMKFVYVEAVRTGAYVRNRFGVKSKTLDLRIYFCRFTDFGNDMRATFIPGGRVSSHCKKNEDILSEIEREIVDPFVTLLDTPDAVRRLTLGQPWTRLPFQYPPSRYDGNELSVMLQLTAIYPQC